MFKFEGKIDYGSKVVAFTRDYKKILHCKAYLTLKVNVKFTSFQTHLGHIDA